MKKSIFFGLLVLNVNIFAVNSTWTGSDNATWSTATNWTPNSVPNDYGSSASFNGSVSSLLNVNVNIDVSLGYLNIANSGGATNYTFTGVSGKTLSVYDQIYVNASGSATTIAVPVILADPVNITSDANSSISFNSGISGVGGFTLSRAGAVNFNLATTYSGQTTINIGTLSAGLGMLSSSSDISMGTSSRALLVITGNNTVKSLSGGGSIGGNVNLGGNTLTLVNSTGAYSGVISGSGGVIQQAGSWTLNGTNSYLGGTALNAGTIILGNSSGLGTGALTMASGTTLVLNSGISPSNNVTLNGSSTIQVSDTATLSGVISNGSSTGSLIKTGSGILTLSRTNTYSGATTLNAGTITLGNSSGLGTGALTMASGTTLVLNSGISPTNTVTLNGSSTIQVSDAATLSGAISNGSSTGSLIKTGSGILTLSGTNTYTGETTIQAGTIKLGSSGALTSTSAISMSSSATIFDLNGYNATIGTLSGTGTVKNDNLSNSSFLTFTSALSSFSGQINNGSGGLGLIFNGNGISTISNSNTYSLGTVLNAGTITLGNSSGLGTGALTMASGTTLVLNSGISPSNNVTLNGSSTIQVSDAATLSGVISNGSSTGSLIKTGSGILTLSGTNTYSGATTLNAGTITLGNSSGLGTGALTMASGTTLVLNNGILPTNTVTLNGSSTIQVSGAATLSGAISDGSSTGSLIKTGAGILTLSGNNTYSQNSHTDGTSVLAGTLSLIGNIVGGIMVDSGATLTGTGAISDTSTISGILRPGTPGSATGSLTFKASSDNDVTVTLQSTANTIIEISPSTSTKIVIQGNNTLTLAGSLQVIADGTGYGTYGQYTIVDASDLGSSVTGRFSSVTGGPSGYDLSLTYGSNYVYLLYGIPPVPIQIQISTDGLSGNGLAVANYLNTNGSASTLDYFTELSGSALNSALNSVSPSRNAFATFIAAQTAFSIAGLGSTHMDNMRISKEQSSQSNLLSALTVDSSDQIAAPPTSKGSNNKHTAWIKGFGEFAHLSGMDQNPSSNYVTGAVVAGLDNNFGNRNVLGRALGYALTHYHDQDSAGHGNTNSYFGSFYGNAFIKDLYISPGIWAVFNQTDNTRNISFPGYSGKAHANIFSWQLIPHLEVGYDFAFTWGEVMPFSSVDWALCWQRAYGETGASPFNAKQKANNSSMVRSETGVKVSETWEKTWGAFILKEKASYVFEKPFGTGTVNTSFSGTPGVFTVNAVNQNLNLAAIGLNFLVALGKDKPIKVDFGYEGEFGASFWSNELMLTLSKDF